MAYDESQQMNEPLIRPLGPGDGLALERFLQQHIRSSMFLLGNYRASGLVDGPDPYQGAYAAAFEGDAIVSVAAHYWNGNLILQAPLHLEAVWRAALQASGRPLLGLLGPAGQVSLVLDGLALQIGDTQMDEVEALYSLDLARLVVPPGLADGLVRARAITAADLPLLTDWRVDYGYEALGQPRSAGSRAAARAGVRRGLQEGRIWLLEKDGRPVAMTGFNAVMDEGVQVGGVWTPPELRSRGYGRAVVAASLLEARATGVPLAILFTGLGNVPARRAYEALGFRQVGDYRIVLLRQPLSPELPGGR
jgi:uncharacterized protein